MYAFFVDFQTAFDGIPRKMLFYKLFNAGLSTKFIKNIMRMYADTASAVWDGKRLSDWFSTTSGVRQGCVFSPAFFAIFINDLVDYIKGGVTVEDIVINVLMYADDIVILADSPEQLQVMIKQLEEYCKLWDFKINLNKSKIMIFGGGRRSAREKWNLGEMEIEIAPEYKYLGFVLTPRLSLQNHFKERLKLSKFSINCTWSSLMTNKDINIDAKFNVFEACSRSVICYGAQVWGYKEHEMVEKLNRYFLKKLIGLPDNTPNYMLLLETRCNKLFQYTFSLHINYVLKCLRMPDTRFPKMLARKIISANIFWYKEWDCWLQKFNIRLDLEKPELLKEQVAQLLVKMEEFNTQTSMESASQSIHHDLYNELKYFGIPSYFTDEFDLKSIRVIFRARGGLLNLNTRLWAGNGTMMCTICNMNEPEDMKHFLGMCPIFKNYRLRFFGNAMLNKAEVIAILNGRDWQSLVKYINAASAYRQFLVDEFNG